MLKTYNNSYNDEGMIFSPNNIGQFGKIYKAVFIQDTSEMTVAVKTIKKYESEQETSDFLHEMRITMDLAHPNIIHLYGIVDEGTKLNHKDYRYVVIIFLQYSDRIALAGFAIFS